jgi:prepilin-type N-terminal cleavage/methylation domain-containing protein
LKKGVTLIELVVAMAIFLVVVTLAIGAFVTISRFKGLSSTMKESQQKTRIALEMITRLSGQAQKLSVENSGDKLILYFKNTSNVFTTTTFEITDGKLLYSECPGTFCLNPPTTNLYEGITLDNTLGRDSKFIKVGSIPPTLTVDLYGTINGLNDNSWYSDNINLNTTIILESIK